MTPSDIGLDVRIRTIGDTAGADQVADALRKAAGQNVTFIGSLGQTAAESEKATNKLLELGHAAHDSERMFAGLERGGVNGLLNALRGMGGLSRLGPEMAEAAAAVGPLAAVVGTAMILMKQKTEEWAKEVAHGVEMSKQLAEKHKEAMESLKKESEAARKQLVEDMKAIEESMSENIKWMDQMDRRGKERNKLIEEQQKAELELKKAREMLGATTDEQRTAISEKYAGKISGVETAAQLGELLGEKLNAPTRIAAAQQAERQARATAEDAAAAAGDAKATLDMKTGAATSSVTDEDKKKGIISDTTIRLQAETVDARRRYDELEKIAVQAKKDATEQVKKSEEIIAAQQELLDTYETRVKTIKMKEAARSIGAQDKDAEEARKDLLKLAPELQGLQSKDATLAAERAALVDANFRSTTLGGDPKNNARIAAIDTEREGLKSSMDLLAGKMTADQISLDKHIAAIDRLIKSNEAVATGVNNLASAMIGGGSGGGGSGGIITRNGQTTVINPALDSVSSALEMISALDSFLAPLDALSTSVNQAKQKADALTIQVIQQGPNA